MQSSLAQLAKLTLLAGWTVAMALSPAMALTSQTDERICLASSAAKAACEVEPAKPCCAKHATPPVEPADDHTPDTPPHCPCCIHIAQAPCALPASIDVPQLIEMVLLETCQPVHLCHASSWVYCEFRPPAR
jgi:hypothetical protein